MPVQFEEDQPFSTGGLPPEKPKAIVKFLMDEGLAWSPRAAKVEIVILTILVVAASIAILIYRAKLTNTDIEIKYDSANDPMVNVTNYRE